MNLSTSYCGVGDSALHCNFIALALSQALLCTQQYIYSQSNGLADMKTMQKKMSFANNCLQKSWVFGTHSSVSKDPCIIYVNDINAKVPPLEQSLDGDIYIIAEYLEI